MNERLFVARREAVSCRARSSGTVMVAQNTPTQQLDEAEQAFAEWVEETTRGEFPNCDTNVAEAIVALESFTAGYEAAKRKYAHGQ